MTEYRLDGFIRDNMEPILQAWEGFARTIEPPALMMDDTELRDHARQMLQAFAADLATPQSEHERVNKSKGLGKRGVDDSAAETHAEARLLSGYTASVSSDHTERTSLGIGLFISREIVHAHGGQIGLESTPAAGTTLTVTMPRLPKGFREGRQASGASEVQGT